MIEHLLLHPQTKTHVAQFVQKPTHALLLVGPNGIGKTHTAEALAAAVLGLPAEKLHQYPYFTSVRTASDKESISIDAIRELQRFLQLRTLGDQPLRRVVIVEHAEALTTEAQNAFLKLLEEPPADTVMILTAASQRSLLPTILSRVQIIPVHPPSEEEVKAYFANQGKDATRSNQAYFLSGGLPGLMHALLDNDETHPLVKGVAAAKAVLQSQTFERLAMVENLSKQKEDAGYMLDALTRIARTGLDQAAQKDDPAKIKQWHHVLKAAHEAAEALAASANAKLVLDNLMLQIK